MVAVITIIVLRAAQEILIMLSLTPAWLDGALFITGEVLVWISTFFAILSGVIYIKQNYHFISDK